MSRNKKTKAAYERRDRALLTHLELYRCGLYQVLSQMLFGMSGKPVGSIAAKLARQDPPLVRIHERVIEGGNNLLTLTPAGYRLLGKAPTKRSGLLQGAALDQAIGIAFFCYLGKSRRHRLDRLALVELMGDAAPRENVPHILSGESGDLKVYRVFQASTETSRALKRVRQLITLTEENGTLRRWLRQRDYGLAILSPTAVGASTLSQTLERAGLENDCELLVGLGPTAMTFHTAMKARKKK